MNSLSRILFAFTLALASGLVAVTPQRTLAQQPITFAYTGVITSVQDQYNWFNNTYAVGASVSGTLTYFFDGNGNYSDFSQATFRLTSLQAVPEPGVYALLGSLGLSGAAYLRRRRAR